MISQSIGTNEREQARQQQRQINSQRGGFQTAPSSTVQIQQRTQAQNGGTQVSQREPSYGGGSSSSYQQAGGGSNAAAEAAVAAAAAAAEQRRNEQQRREKDAGIAADAIEKQSRRKSPEAMVAAGQSLAPLVESATTTATGDKVSPRITPASAEQVADSSQVLEEQPRTLSENTGYLDPETGVVTETSVDGRSYTPARVARDGRKVSERAVRMQPSRMARAMAEIDREADDGRKTRYVSPRSLEASIDDAISSGALDDMTRTMRENQSLQEMLDNWQPDTLAERVLHSRQKAEGNRRLADPGTRQQDVTWRVGQDITGANGRNAQIRRLVGYESDRQQNRYAEVEESYGKQENTNFDAQDHGAVDFDFDADESEESIQKLFSKARNAMYQRFLNPALLRVESEWVETKTEVVKGKTRTYGRIRYSDRVEGAIGAVRRVYDCSIYNVMQLVQLRAGLGVSLDGTIAHVDPNEFRLTDDQFVELCRDICESQRQNGNPLGPVTGTPGANGVRDDTGRFVVVAKTRCFPMGYMPKQLLADLRRSLNSDLHHMSEYEIQKAIGEQWINETYPQLCANTGGNLMYQARAIENMMRGLMMIDGKDPSSLDIPEVVERKTLMALRAESQSMRDPDIADANKAKESALESAMSRWQHRWKKENGTRFSTGEIMSDGMRRRRNKGGDALRRINMLERMAKAANIGIVISNIPETLIANKEQSLANLLSTSLFAHMHKDIAADYQFTPELEAVSQSAEAIEARDVAESLYRIGGHDAIDVFLGELDDDNRAKNRLTRSDLNRFLQEWGVVGSGSIISDMARQLFKIKPGEEAGFLSNVRHITENLENMMLGSNMFKRTESRQFVQLAIAEMGKSASYNMRMQQDQRFNEKMTRRGNPVSRESYTSSQVADWAAIGGGEEMIRSLMKTEAGREAFMTQGVTSLGRKSPVEHQVRLIMAKNGLTEFAVRTMFDRFPEYGINKVMQMVPYSNTLSFLASHGIKKLGDLLEAGAPYMPGGGMPNMASAMQRNLSYQMGSRSNVAEGLRKNLLYDTIMATEKLAIAGIYCGVIMLLGGLQPPNDDKDRYTWSEWKIGDGEHTIPTKWAWFMDDLSGVGFPLGLSLAMMMQGDFSSESMDTATKTFINAVANFNSGTAVFDAIDLVNNFGQDFDSMFGTGANGYDPDPGEWAMTMLEQGFWDAIGDMTPTFIGQLVPWSRDYILMDPNADAHTASKVYDVGEGSKYSMEEAQTEYKTKGTVSFRDYMRRRATQTNILYALFMDVATAGDQSITGYKYTEQPLDTMIDPYVQAMYDKFSLDLDPSTSDLPIEQADREAELYARAETVCQWIDEHYQNALQANLDGFVLNYDARVNCINYCYHMIDLAYDRYNEAKSHGWLANDEYSRIVNERDETIDHYKNLIYNYFQSDDIPWSMPRYVRQESDRETRYVDANGNPMTYLDTLGANAPAHAESYWYGNAPGLLPISSPRTAGKGYNYETIPYWMVLDEDGNPVNDAAAAYDNAGTFGPIAKGRNEGKDVRELMWGGQGNNMWDGSEEELRIERGGVATIGDRPWRVMEETFPDSLKNLDADTVSKLLGIPSSLPTDDEEGTSTSKSETDDSYGGYSSYGRSYGRSYGSSYGSSYGGGGGYSSAYNPKIYSSSRQVYSSRAAGMSTRQPYKATTTYLRPSFSTKGSREAYKRSDL